MNDQKADVDRICDRGLFEDVKNYTDQLNLPNSTGDDNKVYLSFIMDKCLEIVKVLFNKHGNKRRAIPFEKYISEKDYEEYYAANAPTIQQDDNRKN